MATTKKDDRVEIFIPKGNINDDPNLFIGINGKNFILPKGKKSMVPKYVYDEIERSRKAEDAMDERSAALVDAAAK